MNNKPIEKYHLVMRINHWLMALLIISQIALGWYMVPYDENNPNADTFYYYHKSFGVLLFMLIVWRLFCRSILSHPPLPSTMPKVEKVSAKFVHWGLYLLIFLIPVLGYLMSSSYEYSDGVYLFSLFDVPELLGKDEARFEFFRDAHAVAAYTLLGLVVLHIIGALKHRFYDKNVDHDVLPRML